MSIPLQTQKMSDSKHIMYVKNSDGEWIRYMQAKNLKQLFDLFEKAGDETIESVRIQRLRVATSLSVEEPITVDPWDEGEVDDALAADRILRNKRLNERIKNKERQNYDRPK